MASAEILMSKVQRKIWHIAWEMWKHRNKFLHETNYSHHPQEIKEIDLEVEYEWNRNLDLLSPTYSTLFHGTLEDKLSKPHRMKLKWLVTLWALRELHQPDYFTTVVTANDPMTRYRYLKWKTQI